MVLNDDDRPGRRPAADAGGEERYERRYEPEPPVAGVRATDEIPVAGPGLVGSPADPVILPPAPPGTPPATAAQPSQRRRPARNSLAAGRARILAAAALVLLVIALAALVLAVAD